MIAITYHAVVRYLERVKGIHVRYSKKEPDELVLARFVESGIDVEAVRREMCPDNIAEYIHKFISGVFPVDGRYKLVVVNKVVVTIYEMHFSKKNNRVSMQKVYGREKKKSTRRYRWKDYLTQSDDEPLS